jgi:hypothetical protein
MLNEITRNQLVGVWFAAVAVIIAFVVAMGGNVGVGTAAVLLTACVVPPGMVVALWRGAPTETIGEILYARNRATGGDGGSHE